MVTIMEATIITHSHIQAGNAKHFYLYECDTPYEIIVWTTEPLSSSFYISYELTKYLHGVVLPLTQITDYVEQNVYYDTLGLYKSRTMLHLCRFKSPTNVGDSSGKVTLPRAFSMREGVSKMNEYFDKTDSVSLYVYSSLPNSINSLCILSFINKNKSLNI